MGKDGTHEKEKKVKKNYFLLFDLGGNKEENNVNKESTAVPSTKTPSLLKCSSSQGEEHFLGTFWEFLIAVTIRSKLDIYHSNTSMSMCAQLSLLPMVDLTVYF